MSNPFEMRLHDLDDADEADDADHANDAGEPAVRNASRRLGGEPAVPGDGVLTEPIDGRLGRLCIDAHGSLTGVDLNAHALHAMRPDRVTEYLVAAINRAQARAHSELADASRRRSDRRG